MAWQERIVLDPEILTGKPVVRGSRIAVEFVLELLANGWTPEQISKQYDLAAEDIRACLSYATQVLRTEKVYPIPA